MSDEEKIEEFENNEENSDFDYRNEESDYDDNSDEGELKELEDLPEDSEDSENDSDDEDDSDDKEDSDKKESDKEKDAKEEKEKPFWRDILEMVIYFAAVFLLAFLIVTFVGQRTVVEGSSMSPTLSDGDNLIVDKITYRFSDPKRFDVVVFPYQHAKRTYYIKRIIGLPGEEVFIDTEGNIYINGQILEEDYGAEVILNQGRADIPIKLEDDEYFVLGDNRNNSSDSRDFMVGNIKRKDLIGRAFVRIYPFKDFCIIKHGEE